MEKRFATRQEKAVPIIEQCRIWLDASLPAVPTTSAKGKALAYLNNEWPKLIRSLEDGRYRMDNNLAENAIRSFVIGRKNWLFNQSVKGVKASANLYSLMKQLRLMTWNPMPTSVFYFLNYPKRK